MADTPRVTVPVEVIAACEGEQERFEAWAKTARYDMSEHPLHYIFTDPVTNAARRGWNAALSYVRDAAELLSAAPAPEGGAVEQHVEQLRHPEGSAVTVLSDNPHLNGQPNSSSFLAGGSASPAKAGCAAHAAAVLASQGGPR